MDLIIATDAPTQTHLQNLLAKSQHRVTVVQDSTALLRQCLRGRAQLALVDLELGPVQGQDLVGLLREVDHDLLIVPMTKHTDTQLEFAVRSMGVFYYMLKPVDARELTAVLESATRV